MLFIDSSFRRDERERGGGERGNHTLFTLDGLDEVPHQYEGRKGK